MFKTRVLLWNVTTPLLVILAWVVLYASRPFRLGLYHDDWWCLVEPVHSTAPFSLERLRYFVGFATSYGPRPLLGFTAFTISSFVGSSALGLQFVSALLVLAAAISLRYWLSGLLATIPVNRHLVADLAVITWMAMPWMLGVTAWPTLAQTLIAQILFTEAFRLLLLRNRLTVGIIVPFTFLLLGSYLTYEAFYFEAFPVLLLYAACSLGPVSTKREIALLVAAASFAQVIAIGFNRYAAYLGGVTTKRFSTQWIHFFVSNLRSLPHTLEISAGNQVCCSILLIALASSAAILLVVGVLDGPRLALCLSILSLLGLSVFTLLVSTCTYALAGYGFAPFGIESRTLFSASWSLAIAIFALLSCIFVRAFWVLKTPLLLSALGLIGLLTLAQRRQVDDWVTVWKLERSIIAAAPIEDIQRCPRDSAILYVGPTQYKQIVIFSGSWDITPALFIQEPLGRNRAPYQGLTSVFPAGDSYIWTWDGATLVMDLPGYWVQKFPAKHLYVWTLGQKRLEAARSGFRWPPNVHNADAKAQHSSEALYLTRFLDNGHQRRS